MKRLFATIFALCIGCSGRGPAVPRATGVAWPTRTSCDSLEEPLRERADGLLSSLFAHDCCDDTLAACLGREKRCLVAVRLAENVCRRVNEGQDEGRIRLAMSLRARMMYAWYLEEPALIDLEGVPPAGDPGSPVEVVEYADPRGTHCARLTPPMHEAVTTGPLEGKARLYLKVFPLRGNPGSKEAGVAFLAAQELGKLWELALFSYAHFDEFSPDVLPEWAVAAGLDRERFEEISADEATAERLVASKMEGLDNGVESTPSFFIDGRLYTGEMEADEMIDTLAEAFDRSQGMVYEP